LPYPKIPSLRPSLLRMHRTLLKIEGKHNWIDGTNPLSQFEKIVLLLEDRRFFNHLGIDWMSVIREILRLLTFRRHGGASTIDMQLFRTVSNRYERSIRRKVREWVGVLFMQKRLSKVQILRLYVEVAYFGTSLIGARDGAKALFPDLFLDDEYWPDLEKLNLDQAAQLAALLVYPKPRFPSADWHAKIRRRADYGIALYARYKQKFDQC